MPEEQGFITPKRTEENANLKNRRWLHLPSADIFPYISRLKLPEPSRRAVFRKVFRKHPGHESPLLVGEGTTQDGSSSNQSVFLQLFDCQIEILHLGQNGAL